MGFSINFMVDAEFQKLQNVCDAYYRKLHTKGLGASVNTTKPLSRHDEDQLWETGVLNPSTPEGLLNCVFFYNGKNFCLRGGQEHRDMKFSQLKREVVTVDNSPKVCYVYTEYGSKNRSGGLKQVNMGNKVVRRFESPGDRCHVSFLDTYFMKVPQEALDKDNFYLRPLAKTPEDHLAPWFSKIPLGRNTLATMMKSISKKANLAESFSNHSLRAYGATEMFNHGVEEKIIQQRTGHRSLEGLWKYEQTSLQQHLCVSTILQEGTTPPSQPSTSTRSDLPTFSGCTLTGCTINILHPQPTADHEFDAAKELQGIDVQDFMNY
jgi:hypothetical protein